MSLADAASSGLRTEQAPPLSIPASFFALVPLAMVVAGAWLAGHAAQILPSHWSPATMALAHLGTLGLVGSAMLGALYQMIPVVAGAAVPFIRLAHAVFALWLVGLSALVVGFASASPAVFQVAFATLAAALLLFVVPVSVALIRAPSDHDAVWGMRLAVLAFVVAASLGLRLAWAWAGGGFPGDRAAWLLGHAGVGLLGWIGGLIFAVSLQVVPMFYLAPAPSRRLSRLGLGLIGISVVALPTVLLTGGSLTGVGVAAAPAACAIWLLHPWLILRAIASRKRRRRDVSADFWRAGLVVAPLLLPLALLTAVQGDPRWSGTLGWLAIYGWAGLIVHGMLTRIVPFLVWFHRFAALAGKQPVPAMRQLLPDSRARPGLWLHGAAVVFGAGAMLSGWWVAGLLAGGCLAGAGIALAHGLARAGLSGLRR